MERELDHRQLDQRRARRTARGVSWSLWCGKCLPHGRCIRIELGIFPLSIAASIVSSFVFTGGLGPPRSPTRSYFADLVVVGGGDLHPVPPSLLWIGALGVLSSASSSSRRRCGSSTALARIRRSGSVFLSLPLERMVGALRSRSRAPALADPRLRDAPRWWRRHDPIGGGLAIGGDAIPGAAAAALRRQAGAAIYAGNRAIYCGWTLSTPGTIRHGDLYPADPALRPPTPRRALRCIAAAWRRGRVGARVSSAACSGVGGAHRAAIPRSAGDPDSASDLQLLRRHCAVRRRRRGGC